MRFTSAIAASAFAFILVLTGCSTTSLTPQSPLAAAGAAVKPDALQLQLEGKMPTLFPRAALLRAAEIRAHRPRPHLAFRRTASVGLWVSDLAYSYVIGLNASGHQTVTALDVGSNGCEDPNGIKVDHSHNLWVACTFNSSLTSGVIQEYAPGSSTPTATFNDAGCNSPCTLTTASPEDVAFDTNGHIFATNVDVNCSPSCSNNQYPVVWWPANSPNSAPSGITDPNIDITGGFLDVDNVGNLYLSGEGCIGTACGYLVDEISNPTSGAPTITNLIPPSFSVDWEGVYVSDHNSVLNVVDGKSRTVSQYHLSPWTGVAFNTLGPTPENVEGQGQPISGGFNQFEQKLALADAYGWVNVGKVRTNAWAARTSIDIGGLDVGAAFVPSDK